MDTRSFILIGFVFIFALLLGGSNLYPQGTSVQLQINSQPAIDFTADQTSFTLTFSDFKKGSTTNTVDVTYSIMANDVVRLDGVILGKLDDLFPSIDFQVDFGSYTKKGGNAHLVESASGFVTMTTSDTPLANKVIENGGGKCSMAVS